MSVSVLAITCWHFKVLDAARMFKLHCTSGLMSCEFYSGLWLHNASTSGRLGPRWLHSLLAERVDFSGIFWGAACVFGTWELLRNDHFKLYRKMARNWWTQPLIPFMSHFIVLKSSCNPGNGARYEPEEGLSQPEDGFRGRDHVSTGSSEEVISYRLRCSS